MSDVGPDWEFTVLVGHALLDGDDVEEIAAALDPSGHYADDGYLGEIRAAFQKRLAGRVAAAISAAAATGGRLRGLDALKQR